MLDLKAKLLAAGVVTADQVKKVEDDEVARRERDAQRREAERRRREEGPPPRRDDGPRGDRGPRRDDRGPRREEGPRGDQRGPRRDDRGGGPRRDDRGGPRREQAPREAQAPQLGPDGQPLPVVEGQQPPRPRREPRARDTRSFKERRADENLEKRARREHEWTESLKWRARLDDLKAAGKSEQYDAIRGWVMKERLDNNKAISDVAEKFHFVSYAGALSSLTVEPELKERLSNGGAGIVGFVGYNGFEHAVVPGDVAADIKAIKVEWLRHLIGVTDIEPAPVRPPQEAKAEGDENSTVGEGSEGAVVEDTAAAVADVGSDIADDIDNADNADSVADKDQA